jgi:cytoskeletal protein CcmA (bactofilin family)
MDDQMQIERDDGDAASMIGTNITVTGNIEASVDLMIEGQVNGDVRCNTLVLGESSTIKGNIFAERTRISGVVEGSIDTKDLAIEATGNVMGDVSYTRLKIATGGTVEGSMHCKRENEQKLKLVEPDPGPRHIVIE